jgi:hypothetical protein
MEWGAIVDIPRWGGLWKLEDEEPPEGGTPTGRNGYPSPFFHPSYSFRTSSLEHRGR